MRRVGVVKVDSITLHFALTTLQNLFAPVVYEPGPSHLEGAELESQNGVQKLSCGGTFVFAM